MASEGTITVTHQVPDELMDGFLDELRDTAKQDQKEGIATSMKWQKDMIRKEGFVNDKWEESTTPGDSGSENFPVAQKRIY